MPLTQEVAVWRNLQRLLLSVVLLPSVGCAALFASKTTPVAMQSNPAGAEIWIDGNKMGMTPITLELSNKKSYVVSFKKDGQDATYTIHNNVGGGWIVLDILGGLVPVIVDAATGSWYKLSTRTVNLNLAPATSK